MCGRFALATSPKELEKYFGLPGFEMVRPRYNIAPSQPVITVRINHHGEKETTHLQWGLIPSWNKNLEKAKPLINARGETIHEKPSFRSAFKRRRCIVPASGFYEWEVISGGKQPYYFHLKESETMAIAGIWEYYSDSTGTELETLALITTSANQLLAGMHDRMPVILSPEDFDDWLEAPEEDALNMRGLIRPYPAERMRGYPVDKTVNNPVNDSEECIRPQGSDILF